MASKGKRGRGGGLLAVIGLAPKLPRPAGGRLDMPKAVSWERIEDVCEDDCKQDTCRGPRKSHGCEQPEQIGRRF